MLEELIHELNTRGADFIKVVDISMLSAKENKGYNAAILIGIALSPDYIFHLSMENISDNSEFGEKEHRADDLAEWTADFIINKGYSAFAQSEKNLLANGSYELDNKNTPLPHKTIALLSGLGWIGKSSLLVTHKYGSAFCMCTVLTDAPVPTENKAILTPRCGECTICVDTCPVGVIHGLEWKRDVNRDSIVDVYNCITCLKCLANCPWTQEYMNNSGYESKECNI